MTSTRALLSITVALAMLAGCAAPAAPPSAQAMSAVVRARSLVIQEADRAQFREADRDGDGRLTPGECPLLPEAGFASLDGDADGALSFEEAMSQTLGADQRARLALEARRALAAQRLDLPEEPVVARGNPVVFVPGWLDGGFWFIFVRRRLAALGRKAHFVPLFPNLADITQTAEVVRRHVAQVRQETGAEKVDVMAHSMGGLITRYYLKHLGGTQEVARYLSMATPHHGTYMAFLHPPAPGVQQMRPGSPFLEALNAGDETPGDLPYVSIRAGLDQIVIPHASPILEGAANYEVRIAEHNTVQFQNETWAIIEREWGEDGLGARPVAR